MTPDRDVAGINRLRKANKAEVAEFFEVSIKAVDGWVRRGCPVVKRGTLNDPWVFDLLAVAEWRITGNAPEAAVDPDKLPPNERRAWYESESRKRELQIKDRQLIHRAEIEQAVATAFAALAQEMKAITDNLERRFGITPEIIEAVEESLHVGMEGMRDRLATLSPNDAVEAIE
jgi:phage terminase Nu1 subunit (DNA packaging protein)